MARCRIGDKPLFKPMLTRFTDAYTRHEGEMDGICRINLHDFIQIYSCQIFFLGPLTYYIHPGDWVISISAHKSVPWGTWTNCMSRILKHTRALSWVPPKCLGIFSKIWFYKQDVRLISMMTSSNGNIFHVTGPLWGESTGPRWIPLTKASDAKLWCFIWSAPEQTFE